MKTSEFHIGSVLLLTATLLTGGLAVLMLFPMLGQKLPAASGKTSSNSKSDELTVAAITQGQKYAEFYPPEFQTVSYPKPQVQTTEDNDSQNIAQNPDTWNPNRNDRSKRHTFAVADPFATSGPFGNAQAQSPTPPFGGAATATNSRQAFAAGSGFQHHVPRAATTQQPTVASTAGQLPPNQLPPGSVYAPVTVHPVTVNVDGAILAQQMQGIQQRFEHLLQQQQEARNRKTNDTARRQNRRQRAEQQEAAVANEQLAKSNQAVAQLETELSKLIVEFRELKTQTDAQLKQLTLQADRTRVAEQAVTAYKKALDDAERRLAESAVTRIARQPTNALADYSHIPGQNFEQRDEDAGRVVIGKSTGAGFNQSTTTVPPVPVVSQPAPFGTFPPPVSDTESGTRYFEQSPKPQPVAKPVPRVQPEPLPFPDAQPSAELEAPQDIQPRRDDRFALEITDTNTDRVPPLPTLDGIPVEQHEVTFDFVTQEKSQKVEDKSSALNFLPAPDASIVPVPPIADNEPVQEYVSQQHVDSVYTDLVSPLEAIELTDTNVQNGELHPVPAAYETDTPRPNLGLSGAGKPVAFEQVYRFDLADVEGGKVVVPADGPVCPQCGKVHNGYGKQGVCDSPKIITTTAYVPMPEYVKDGHLKAETSSPPAGKNAARGSNRHVNRNSGASKSKGYLPRLRFPSMTTRKDEPGVLHRISSSLFNWRRPTVK